MLKPMELLLRATIVRAVTARQSGQALVEYALIISMIALVSFGVLAATGTHVTTLLQGVANGL